jgi:hypothetical protein
VSQRKTTIVLKRSLQEKCINQYNATLYKAWGANLDIQFVVDPFAVIMYIAAYMTKSERNMGELLKQTAKEYRDADIHKQLKKLGSTFLNKREVSAQEAAYRMLAIPLRKFSREIVFVNTDKKCDRAGKLKHHTVLQDKDDDCDIFETSLLDRYAARPDSHSQMSLATFASNYSVNYGRNAQQNDAGGENENEEPANNNQSKNEKITLKNGLGRMSKRRKEAVIRFRRLHKEKEPDDFFRAKLMLFLPWRDEERDLILDYDRYQSHYLTVRDDIHEEELKFTKNLELIEDAINELHVNGSPEHAWAGIAPELEHQNEQDQHEGAVEETSIEEEDLQANADLTFGADPTPSSDMLARFQPQLQYDMIPNNEYREMMRKLNTEQKQIVDFHRDWCKKAVVDLKENKKPKPYRVYLNGAGGTGKSYVIRMIQSDTKKILAKSQKFHATDLNVLLVAPTGVAAFQIKGMTIHSALLLPLKGNYAQLTYDKLNSLRTRWRICSS